MQRDAATSKNEPVTGAWRMVITCVLVTLVGFNLRSVILAVPPVLPLIQHDLMLSYAATGLLTALPILVLAVGAWPAGFLIEHIGGRACVTVGLLLLGAGTLLRAFLPSAATLFLFTLLLSLGIALGQTAVPVLVRQWFPRHIGLVAALFSDGLILGEAVAAGITVPVMVLFLGRNAWTSTFVFWGIPVVTLLVLWLWLAPPGQGAINRAPTRSIQPPGTLASAITQESGDRKGRPYISRKERTRVSALHLGIVIGCGSLIYFGMNAWIASYNQALHHMDLTPLALATLNAAQIPSSLLVTLLAQQLAGRRWPFIVAGTICAVSISGWIFTPVSLEVFWAALLGGSSALVFTLGLALPPLLARHDEVARLTGISFSLTYAVAFVGPFIGGELWDIFHLPAVAFVPVAAASVTLIVLGSLLPSRATFGLIERPGRPEKQAISGE